MSSTTTTDRTEILSLEGEQVTVTYTTRHYPATEATTYHDAHEAYSATSWVARTSAGALLHRSGWEQAEVTDKDIKAIVRAIKKWKADEAILPAANAAALDHGSRWDARTDPRFTEVDFSKVQVGDLVWVLSYQLHRRGVVEAIGRTNLKVAVVVQSTRSFSRQSVKAGEVWWDNLNA